MPVCEAADHMCWRVEESYFLAPVPHSSLAAVWVEIPFFSTSGFFRRNNTRELQKNKRASQKAFQGYEMFLLVESLGPGCPGLCWIGASLRQHPVGASKSSCELYLFWSPPPIFLSSCGVPLSSWVGEGGSLGRCRESWQGKLVGYLVKDLTGRNGTFPHKQWKAIGYF